MIYCILDANILNKDPFFRDGDLKKLLILSQLGYVKILLPDVVVQELKNHVLADNENELKKIKESIKRLNKTCLNTFPAYSISDNLSEKFDLRIKKLTDTGNVIVIPSTPVTIKEIMDRYGIHKKPFDDNKASFRDAAIWLETIKYVKTEGLNDCYFISNNYKDFADKDGKDFHPDLKEESEGMIYLKLVHDFLSLDRLEEIKEEMQEEVEYQTSVISFLQNYQPEFIAPQDGNLYQNAMKIINTSCLEKYKNDEFLDNCNDELIRFISEYSPSEIGKYYDEGYVELSYLNGITGIDCDDFFYDKEKNQISIFGNLTVNADIEIFAHNWCYERDDPADVRDINVGTEEIDLAGEYTLVLSLDGLVQELSVEYSCILPKNIYRENLIDEDR